LKINSTRIIEKVVSCEWWVVRKTEEKRKNYPQISQIHADKKWILFSHKKAQKAQKKSCELWVVSCEK